MNKIMTDYHRAAPYTTSRRVQKILSAKRPRGLMRFMIMRMVLAFAVDQYMFSVWASRDHNME